MGDCWYCPRLGTWDLNCVRKLVTYDELQAWKRHAELGYLALTTGLDVRLPGDIKRDDWDHWHTLVLTDEMARVVGWRALSIQMTSCIICIELRCNTCTASIPSFLGSIRRMCRCYETVSLQNWRSSAVIKATIWSFEVYLVIT